MIFTYLNVNKICIKLPIKLAIIIPKYTPFSPIGSNNMIHIKVNMICLKNVNPKLKSPLPKLCKIQPDIILQLANAT